MLSVTGRTAATELATVLASFAVEAEIERVAPHAILTALERSDVLRHLSARAAGSPRCQGRCQPGAALRVGALSRSTRPATTRLPDATIDLGACLQACAPVGVPLRTCQQRRSMGALFSSVDGGVRFVLRRIHLVGCPTRQPAALLGPPLPSSAPTAAVLPRVSPHHRSRAHTRGGHFKRPPMLRRSIASIRWRSIHRSVVELLARDELAADRCGGSRKIYMLCPESPHPTHYEEDDRKDNGRRRSGFLIDSEPVALFRVTEPRSIRALFNTNRL